MALLLALTLTAAGCDEGDPVDPGNLPGGSNTGGTSGGGGDTGGSTGSLGNDDLVGRWQNIVSVDAGSGLQRISTTWVFDSTGTCAVSRVTSSAALAEPTVDVRTGTCVATSTTLAATVTGSSIPQTFTIGFANLARTVLLIDGIQYDKQDLGS